MGNIQIITEETEQGYSKEEAEQLLRSWREQYGPLYIATLDEIDFVYRLLSFSEFEALQQQYPEPMDLDEAVCSLCVLDPILEWDEEIFAGCATNLSRTILEQSLLLESVDPELDALQLIKEKEAEINESFLKQVPLIIKHCFQEYTLEELEATPLPKQIELYAKAKWILLNLEGIDLSLESD